MASSYPGGDTAVYDPQLLAISHQQLNAEYSSASVDDLFSTEQIPSKADTHDQGEPPKDDDGLADDLFGDDEDAASPPSVTSKEPSPEADSQGGDESAGGLPAHILKQQKALEYGEEDAPEEAVVELKHATLAIPNLPAPRSSDGKHWVLRLPNFIKLDTKPFHPDTYVGPEHNDEFMRQQQGQTNREKSMSIKLEVENTIRWRWAKDEFGQNRRQSNSRVVRWSDGSLSLLLGKELFDINQAVDTAASAPRNFMGSGGAGSQSQSQSQPSQPSQINANERIQGLTYLVAQHKRSGILQAEAPITGYMTLRPTGMQSETHRMLVRAVGQKHNKVARLRMTADPVQDPEREKMEMIKMEAKKGRRPRGEDDGFGNPRKRRTAGGAGAGGGSRRSRRMHDSMWSDDDDAELGTASGASEEEDEHDFDGADRRKQKRQGANNSKADYQADGFVVEDSSGDDDMDDSDGGKSRKKRRAGDERAEDVVDALDEMDAKIAQQEEERKKSRGGTKGTKERSGGGDDGSDPDAMDVESEEEQEQPTQQDDEDEEEEEEFQVRKSGAGARRKRAIAIDEDDEEE